MNNLKILILFFSLIGIVSCKNQDKTEETPTYYIQIYASQNSQLSKTLGREFGELKELKNEFILDDSSAYVWAWKVVETTRNVSPSSTDEVKEIFSHVNEFKIYDSNMIELTNKISFQGIENYPNPAK